MNDRYEEMEALSRELNELPLPGSLNGTSGRVKKRIVRHRIGVGVRAAAAALCVFLLIVFTGVNTSEAFAGTVANLPIIGELARIFSINHGAEDAFMAEYGTFVGQSQEFVNGGVTYQLELSYAMADDTSLEMFLKAADIKGREKHELIVLPLWVEDLTTGEQLESISRSSVSVATGADQSSTIISWGEYHRDIRVAFGVETIRSIDGTLSNILYNDREIPGDSLYTLTYDIHLTRYDAPVEYALMKEFTVCGGRYVVEKVVVYPLSTEVWIRGCEGSEAIFHADLATTDGNGNRKRTPGLYSVGANSSTGLISYGYPGGLTGGIYMVDSGYYAYPDEMYLELGRFEILPERLKEVRFDPATGVFTDADGVMDEVKFIPAGTTDASRFYNLIELERSFIPAEPASSPFWIEIWDPNGDNSEPAGKVSVDLDNSRQTIIPSLIFNYESLDNVYDSEGRVRLERTYPSDYEIVNLSIKLK